MQSFDIYFLGEMLPGADPDGVRRGVAKLFKVQENSVDRLFSGKALRVKQAVDADVASRYRSAFRDIGALVQIVPGGSPPPSARPAAAPPTPASRTEPEGNGAKIPTAGDVMDLAAPGATIDLTKPAPPANIDTGSLEALPPNTGSLEDCQVEKPHQPIPDISHLGLRED